MTVLTTEESQAEQYQNYTKRNLTGYDKVLVFTKDSDNLPLSAFRVEVRPCSKQNEVSRSSYSVFYPLENKLPNCTADVITGHMHDDRFTSVGLSTTELEVQENSGVLAKLREQPLFEKYVANVEQAKD